MLRTVSTAFTSYLKPDYTPAWQVSPIRLALKVVDCLQTPSKCHGVVWGTLLEKNTGISAFHKWEYRSEVRELTERMFHAAIGADLRTYTHFPHVGTGSYRIKYYD